MAYKGVRKKRDRYEARYYDKRTQKHICLGVFFTKKDTYVAYKNYTEEIMSKERNIKTPFMWSGSKDRYYKDIKNLIASYDVYVEPFVGGGSFYFRELLNKGSINAVLADVNKDLVKTYLCIKDYPEELCDGLPLEKNKEIFQSLMESHPTETIPSAIRFLYLNRNRFFGMGGWMNADRYCRDALVKRIRFFSPFMQKTQIIDTGCWDINVSQFSNPFFFIDPPYPSANNKACYEVSDKSILDLNVEYAKFIANSGYNFYFISSYHQDLESVFCREDIKCSSKNWQYRKPQQNVQDGKEIHAYRRILGADLFSIF